MISHGLKLRLRDALRSAGFEVRPSNVNSRFDLRLKALLDLHQPGFFFDIGANRGQFAEKIFSLGYAGKIVSFEAVPRVHAELESKAAAFGDRWIVAPRCAVSDTNGHVTFHVTNNIASSSMLDIADYSKARSCSLREAQTIVVESRRLDDILAEFGLDVRRPFLKLDVQGAEDRVLAGASVLVEKAQVIVCEILLAPFYVGQTDWRQLDAGLVKRGFELFDLEPVMRTEDTGRLEAADLVYVRRDFTLPECPRKSECP